MTHPAGARGAPLFDTRDGKRRLNFIAALPLTEPPRGWFHAERVVELLTDRPLGGHLTQPPTLGSNFERRTFAAG